MGSDAHSLVQNVLTWGTVIICLCLIIVTWLIAYLYIYNRLVYRIRRSLAKRHSSYEAAVSVSKGCIVTSDVKFHEIFGVKYFVKYFVKCFWNISNISHHRYRNIFPDEGLCAGCIVHCNKVSKAVKGKYLLLCMKNIMYFLPTSYTLIMFLKVLSHFIIKIKNFMKYFKKGSWNISKFPWNF